MQGLFKLQTDMLPLKNIFKMQGVWNIDVISNGLEREKSGVWNVQQRVRRESGIYAETRKNRG